MCNICIIENNINDYSFFANALGNYNLTPQDNKSFKKLRAAISTKYETGKKPEAVILANQQIKSALEGREHDLHLVDYILKDGNSLCNGLRFIEDFIPGGKVMIITTGGSADDKNKIMRFIEENNAKYSYLKIIYKPDLLDDNFRELLLKEIRKICCENADPKFDPSTLRGQ